MTPRIRVIAKVWAFGFALFFIFFFVVHGYRYTDGVWFMTKNAYYEGQFWTDWQVITFDDVKYVATDNKVQLFNIDAGCYDITYRDTVIKKCLQKNSVHIDTFVTVKWVKPYEESIVAPCAWIQRIPHGVTTIFGIQYAHPIQNAFVAREMSFLQVNNILYSCTSDFGNCRQITENDWEFVCSEKEWLVFNKEGKLFMLEME